MQIKGMQADEGSTAADDHLPANFSEKVNSIRQDERVEATTADEIIIKNGNGTIHDADAEGSDKQSNSSRSHSSPTTDQESTLLPSNDANIGQPLNFELGAEVHGTSGNNFWPVPPQEDTTMFTSFQTMNPPQSMPNYSLNNNNSFPQPMHFGSIGQPPNYMAGNHGQFASPPGMHNMSMMNNMGSVNGPMGGINYQTSHSQNQRRAITAAQHSFGSMGGKPTNPRLQWNNQQPSVPNGNQQSNVSPWTAALQQQKVMNSRGSAMNVGFNTKKAQSNIHPNHALNLGNQFVHSKYSKRSSPVPSHIAGAVVKCGYGGAVGAESAGNIDAPGYLQQSGMTSADDSMKMDSLQTQLMDIARHTGQYEHEPSKGSGEQRTGMNGSFPFQVYRPDRPERYSRKVFVGGLPPDIDEDEITSSFRKFGPVVVDWPHKAESKSYFPPKGYCFLLFQEELSVQRLIDSCLADDSKLYWCVTSPTMKDKPVQIRPWNLTDSDYVLDGSQTLDPRKTIFVGGVPRPLRAVELAMIIDQLYGGVCYAGIDTDPELKYPKGAGRVAFSNQQSYIAAISARFVQLQHCDIDKRVEVKPYVLDDQFCDECQGARCNQKFAPFFCANVTCLQYYCEQCWAAIHARAGREYHKPLVKEGADRPRAVPFRWC